ncbi:bacteriocin-processing peptidase. Cysteine peptidase. MEROPS family C39 [Pseudarcicella hirudinis]|uniref:Bacteriocin-processing peptidase. Cysteine peptidase. MEROPS family C39 n=1 Tax=Pseudarcicella hirudinis TaxID=1079859 RepID=A0A1I5TRX1_9BACT|nr:peptidase domain-containing ABC transporter [Pseudarcicella hirudinis]SFP85066.1 bacteriocin-processing peptidase. Cysteine peptidase. MEROPS family C39 [Pseudarcicella hirudinis]
MKRGIKIKQHDITDCGAACLASVSVHYGLNLPISRIRQYASTDKKGTNVLGMIEAAEKLGYQAKGVRGTFESLEKIPKPAIAHIIVKEVLHHFVVIYDVTDKYVVVMDPGDGCIHKKTHEEFKKEWTGVLILLLPDEQMFKKGDEKVSVLRRFWFLINPHKTIMVQALFGAALYTILGLSTSIYIQKITDHVLIEGNKNLLNLLSVTMVLLLLFQLFIGSLKTIFALKTGQKIDAQLILGYYKHLMKLPQQFFDTMRVGEIISRVNDAVKIRIFINDVALNLVVNLFVIIFSFGLMFTYYWKLALMMLSVIPMYGIVYYIANRINRKQQRKLMENSADLETQLVESLTNAATIKRFGVEPYANLKTETRFVSLLKTIYTASINGLYTNNATDAISKLLTIILLWVGSALVIDNELTPGELLSFYSLIGYFTGPASSLISMNKTVQDALIAADRLFEIMDLEREEVENKFVIEKDMVDDIHFKNVSFRYGSRVSVFSDLTLDLPKGKITAVVGESGSGKSTLMSLLQNLYKLQSGTIHIGSFDIKHIQNESLRKIVSVVPQQTDLFAGSIIENIALGEHDPDMKRIVGICQMLGITEFVEKIPGGFGAYVGENGANLSGGQKQRIAIARALYRNPEILILDEATASLDSVSEQYVQRTIQTLRQLNKTIIIIAHRLSTIRNADKIVVLKDGKLVEEGTHEELIRYPEGNYNKLWRQQFGMEETAQPYSMAA